MIEDRPYMREPNFREHRPFSITLIIILVVVWIVQNFVGFYVGEGFYRWLALTPSVLQAGWVWQLFTFQFLHAPFGFGGLAHIFFNCLILYMLGAILEGAMSRKNFIALIFLSGAFGGIVQAVGHWLIPRHFGLPAVGASAGISGMVAAFAFMFPNMQLLLFGVLPLTATVLFWVEVAIALFGILVPQGSNLYIAHGAHLGGLIAGWLFVKYVIEAGFDFGSIKINWPTRKKTVTAGGAGVAAPSPRAKMEGDLPSAEFISKEVDPILDKISEHGINSLTERERKILEAARSKMAKR